MHYRRTSIDDNRIPSLGNGSVLVWDNVDKTQLIVLYYQYQNKRNNNNNNNNFEVLHSTIDMIINISNTTNSDDDYN